MPTIGELLAEIRNGGMNPEGTGTSPYGGEEPGTNDPTSQPGLDDISDDTRASIGDYLSQKTKGFERLEEQNMFPVEPDLTPLGLTDPSTGQPAPLTTVSDPQEAFIQPTPSSLEELNLRTGFQILDRLGFFLDLEGIDGPSLDKNAQTDGHTLLNSPTIPARVGNILETSRFSALTSPNAPFATPLTDGYENIDFVDEFGVRKDHPQLEKIKQIAQFVLNTGQRAKDAFPESQLTLARDPSSNPSDPRGVSANLNYGTVNPETGLDPDSGMPDSTDPDNGPPDGNGSAIDFSSSNGVLNTPDFPFGIDHNDEANVVLGEGLDEAMELLEPALDLLSGLTSMFSYGGIYTNQPHNPSGLAPGQRFGFGNFPSPTAIDFETGETSGTPTFPLANAGYAFLRRLGIPVPRFTITATGNPNDIIKRLVQLGLTNIKEQLAADPTVTTFWKTFVRKLKRMVRPGNNFGLPQIPDVPFDQLPNSTAFLTEFKDCVAMQFIRSMCIIAENIAASGVSGGSSLTPQPYRFSRVRDLNRMVNSAANRHAANRFSSLNGATSVRNIPSLLLLPNAFKQGRSRFVGPGGSAGTIGLTSNEQTNDLFYGLLQVVAAPAGLSTNASSAALNKLGEPVPDAPSANRFSREEVEAIENMLEAEHVPFYFHDLRTNEIVAFHAFLNALSDSFSPQYNASSGFGRIDDVQIYSKTSRSINIDFTLISYNKKDMREMYFKMNKLIAMVYPQFSRGTMLEHNGPDGVTRFVQPFSQVTTATPVIRMRVGDLIKSNYSREAIARLMGVADPNFQVLEQYDPVTTTIEGVSCETATMEIYNQVNEVPLTPEGGHDDTRGWPVGSIVILDPPYNPLVAFDPDTNTVGSDWSATIVEGNIGVKILSYHPFSNPLGGTSPNQEEIVIKVELVPSNPAPGFPTQNRIATRNSTGEAITTAFLSYRDINHMDSAALICHGVNTAIFPDTAASLEDVDVTTQDPPPTTAEIDAMRERLFGDKNPIMRSFETTAGRGLAGVITSLNFDWGINDTINWDTRNFGYKAPKGCKISIAFTPIHDVAPGLDSDGMIRAPVFNVAGSSPHRHEDVHPEGMDARDATYHVTQTQYLEDEP